MKNETRYTNTYLKNPLKSMKIEICNHKIISRGRQKKNLLPLQQSVITTFLNLLPKWSSYMQLCLARYKYERKRPSNSVH